MAVVEICAEGIASAVAAERGGADRVELCAHLAVGGITPSAGAVVVACGELAIPVHVLIRPREGDFVYSRPEFDAMECDIAFTKQWAAGVVLGLLTRNGRVNRARTAELIATARPMSVTFHKAFDAAADPLQALDDLIELGVDRVLTSGRAATAREGVALLAELSRRAAGRIAIMAGGAIDAVDVPGLVAAGVREIHAGSSVVEGGKTDADRVRRLVAAAKPPVAEILHLTTRYEWDRAVANGEYRAASLATEGFIHASTAAQVAGSANRYFRGRTGVVVLRIDPTRVEVPVLWEMSTHSATPFPHLFGPLNLEAVVGVIPLEPDVDGGFSWPGS